MRVTNKQKLDEYPALKARADLLELYLFDTQLGNLPDATETNGVVRGQLYRAQSASGGYVVMREGRSTSIDTLDEWNRRFSNNFSEHALSLRIVLERLTLARRVLYMRG